MSGAPFSKDAKPSDLMLRKVRRSLFFVSAPMVFIMFALPLRAEDLGATAFEIGILYSLFTACIFLVRPLVGIGLDVFGRRPFFILATFLYLGASMLYAASETVAMLYAARFLQGIGFAVLAIATDTITADITEIDERSAAMGGNIASQTRGGMAGAFVGFGLVGAMPEQSWTYSFCVFSLAAFAAVIIAIRLIPETMPTSHQGAQRAKFVMPNGYYRILAIIFAAAFAGAIIQPYYLIYLRGRFDLELYALAVAFLPVGVAYAVLPVWLGRISGRLDRAVAVTIGLTLAGLAYAAAPVIGPFVWVIAAFLAASIGAVLVDLTKNAWVADISGKGAAGRTFGLAALAAGAGAAAGPLAGGVVYDGLGPDYVFYFAAAVFLATALLAFAIKPRA